MRAISKPQRVPNGEWATPPNERSVPARYPDRRAGWVGTILILTIGIGLLPPANLLVGEHASIRPAITSPADGAHYAVSAVRASTPSTAPASGGARAPFVGYVWENISGPVAPSARYGSAEAFDAADGYLLLFGGIGPSGVSTRTFSDTWILENGSWTNITSTAGHPPAPYEAMASLAYDAQDRYVVMLDTSGTATNTSTWIFTNGSWAELSGTPQGPLGNLVYDSSVGYVVATTTYYGCYASTGSATTYLFRGGIWTRLSSATTPCLYDSRLSDDPGVGGVLAYGGYQYSGSTVTLAGQWTFSNGNWSTGAANQSSLPPWTYSYYSNELTYVPPESSVLLPVLGATETWMWAFNGTWSNLSQSSKPTADWGASFGWDSNEQGVVLFGGERLANTTSGSYLPTNETWVFTSHPALHVSQAYADPSVADVGTPVAFAPAYVGGVAPLLFNWSFGDGTFGSLANATHSYASSGSFTARVTVTDSAGATGSATTTVTIVPAVAGGASASPDATDVGLPTLFTDAVVGGDGNLSYAWQFGDGSASGSAAPVHTYTARGNYTVDAWANDTGGGSSHSSFLLPVNPALALNFTVSPTAPNLGELVNFSAFPTGGTTPYRFAWSFGDGGTGGDLQNISHIFTTDGPFVTSVSVTDAAGAIVVSERNLTVALNLSVLGSSALGAAPLPVLFSSAVEGGVPGYAFSWRFGDGSSSTVADPRHTFTLPGYYTATLTVTDRAGDSAEAGWSLFVATGHGPLSVGIAADPSVILPGESTVLTAVPTGGAGAYSLVWNSGSLSCVPSGLLAQRCTAATDGTFEPTVTIQDAGGNSSRGSTSVTVGVLSTVVPPQLHSPAAPLWTWIEVAGIAAAVAIAAALAWLAQGRSPSSDRRPSTSGGAEPAGSRELGDRRDRASGTAVEGDGPGDDPLADMV